MVDLIVVVEVTTPLRKSWHAELTRLRLFPHWLRIFTVGSVRRLSSGPAPTVVVMFNSQLPYYSGYRKGRLEYARLSQWVCQVVVVRVVLAVVVVETTTVTVGAATWLVEVMGTMVRAEE